MIYKEVIQELEALSIMPKTMPGLEKLKKALSHKSWFQDLNPQKIIIVAGTNGKGTTCAALESLLVSAGKSVGLFTSPHLVSTTERIRLNSFDISEVHFVSLYLENKNLITKYELTHFESLTLMAADYFFAKNNLDYVIFEVGLGGTFDATNVFPNDYSVITALGVDHQNILGNTLVEIAKNKFGIIKNKSVVVHHQMPSEVDSEFKRVIQQTQSQAFNSYSGEACSDHSHHELVWSIQSTFGSFPINIPGQRACDNIMTALTLFEKMGFDPKAHLKALNTIRWHGRMEKINWPNLKCPVYLSGDHNVQGVLSLIDLLTHYRWKTLHIIVGVGVDKDADEILNELFNIKNAKIYLTQTPFKGRVLNQYSEKHRNQSAGQNDDPIALLNQLETTSQDMVLVTGSLYLVGRVLMSSLPH